MASPTAGVGGPQGVGGEGLRGLDGHQVVAVDGGHHPAAVHPLQGVGHRHTGTAPSTSPAPHGLDHRGEQLGCGQRAGGVVDHDDGGVVGDGGQPGPHRVGPGRPTGHHAGGAQGGPAGGAGSGGPSVVVRPGAPGTTRTTPSATERAARTDQEATGLPGQGEELLGAAEPAARAAGDHDGPDGPRSAQGSASLRRTSAVSSSTPRAKVSSDTRIWRARLSMRFSPADRPLSLSRIERFRTTSATW